MVGKFRKLIDQAGKYNELLTNLSRTLDYYTQSNDNKIACIGF